MEIYVKASDEKIKYIFDRLEQVKELAEELLEGNTSQDTVQDTAQDIIILTNDLMLEMREGD